MRPSIPAAAIAALLISGCTTSTAAAPSDDARAVHYAVVGCRDFTADDQMFDRLDPLYVHTYLSDVRGSTAALQHAADLDNGWVTLAYNARIVVDALRKADAAVEAGRNPTWTEGATISAAAWTVRTECRRAQTEILSPGERWRTALPNYQRNAGG
ncbi:hypothetical protein [Streptomyces murinus]